MATKKKAPQEPDQKPPQAVDPNALFPLPLFETDVRATATAIREYPQ